MHAYLIGDPHLSKGYKLLQWPRGSRRKQQQLGAGLPDTKSGPARARDERTAVLSLMTLYHKFMQVVGDIMI